MCRSFSLKASRLAVATASWMARIDADPPTGDMACAASPMHSTPGRPRAAQPIDLDAQKFDVIKGLQLIHTVRKESERRRPRGALNVVHPLACTCSMPPLAMTQMRTASSCCD